MPFRARYKLWRAKSKGLHEYLKESEATLYITKPEYAYLEVDGVKYYFHNSNPRVVRYRDIKTASGEKVKQSIVPYDGYEVSMCKDCEEVKDE